MTEVGYHILKEHFDKLFIGSYPTASGLEQIKDVYNYAFGKKIHLYDIYKTKMRVFNNPIDQIMCFVGPDDDELKTGVVPCLGDIDHVTVIDKNLLRGLNDENIENYIGVVYMAMHNIMSFDKMYDVDIRLAQENPYCVMLKCCPMYFTYHHINSVAPDYVDCDAFREILEKYICSSEADVDKVLISLASHKYSTDFEDIYKTMTCDNTIELFC